MKHLSEIFPFYDDGLVTIYNADCTELLPMLARADLVIADVPYSFGLNSTDEGASWGDLMNAASVYATWLREFRRVTAEADGAAWVFNSWRSQPVLSRAAYEARWPITSMMIWDKMRLGTGSLRGLRSRYEQCALFMHPGFAIRNRALPDIWPVFLPHRKPTGHKSEKPVELIERIITESGGDLILDPFLGSGTTAIAAKRLGKRCVGIEIEKRWCEVAVQRVRQESSAPES